ncbi:MAG: hypothetical protein IKP36_02410 [Bacteroidaceae bacterium]|nr:hypothetical protein [Bacteroidaceae bacterium]
MKRTLTYLLACLCVFGAKAWERKGVTFSGSIQSDMLVPRRDSGTGAEKTGSFLTNTYADLLIQSQYIDAGARLEFLSYPLPGFEKDFEGWGVPHFWMKGNIGKAELTVGTFYEQFGSGFILRTYEERALGIDNALLGGRVVVKPVKGVTLKALSGVQRRYWEWNEALISGADAEIGFDEFFPALQKNGTDITLGGSWVNKYEKSDEKVYLSPTYRLRLPKFVNAWDVRASFGRGPWNVMGEYAQKSDDPSFANGYIYRKGSAAMLSGSYSGKGLSVLLQAKRSENMSFKSTSDVSKAIGISSAINHLPAFTQDQTYALAAIYPYATQLADGEWAYQAEVGYNFKRKTPLGGRYGMNVKANLSYVRAIDRQFYDGDDLVQQTNGYTSKFFKWGDDTYYRSIDITLSRKLSKAFKLNLMYVNQRYNQSVVEGHGGIVHTNIFIADGKYQFSPKVTLRGELQYLRTKEDQGDWAYGLLELSLVPHWMITVSDMWNCGETKLHYYQGLVTYNVGQHRIQAGYGRTRAGLNCSGGVCRMVPAYTGWTLSYNFNF